MKKIILLLIAFLLLMPGPGIADYLVTFKNGGRLKARDVKMEGSVLYLEALGGTIGIPVDRVLSVQEVAFTKSKPEPPPLDEVVQEEKGENEKEQVAAEQDDNEQEKSPAEYQQERKAGLIEELKRDYRLFTEEITKSNRLQLKKRIAKIKEGLMDLKELEEDVRKTNGGALPAWWLEMPLPEPPAGL
ncbi:MAG: hypothetical protein L3J03_02255 [Desulfobacterales bacterium]|nr:hypothetical protein [Desulfobacterales bacterium]